MPGAIRRHEGGFPWEIPMTDTLARTRRCDGIRHRPVFPVIDNTDLRRSRCRFCGCALVQIRPNRSWFVSGMLG